MNKYILVESGESGYWPYYYRHVDRRFKPCGHLEYFREWLYGLGYNNTDVDACLVYGQFPWQGQSE